MSPALFLHKEHEAEIVFLSLYFLVIGLRIDGLGEKWKKRIRTLVSKQFFGA